jgi:hypothetical protein
MNIAIVNGTVISRPVERTLGTGELATSFDVVTESTDGRLTVPVNWVTTVSTLISEGDVVLAVGSVRRRFFQSGGAVQSRTELLASDVIPVRRKAAIRRALEASIETISLSGNI